MLIIPISTRRIEPRQNLISLFEETWERNPDCIPRSGDIVVISSKAIAMSEGHLIDLASLTVTDEARQWVDRLRRTEDSAAFRQAVLNETERMHGRVLPGCPLAMLTELKPDGLSQGVILAANAGLDHSNCPKGFAIGWPLDPIASVVRICSAIERYLQANAAQATLAKRHPERRRRMNVLPNPPCHGSSGSAWLTTGPLTMTSSRRTHDPPLVACLVSDSCCHPRRVGVSAYALAVSGIDPFISDIGKEDLFGHTMVMTQEAIADQLATAANCVMGNTAQSIPAVIIRDHGFPLSYFSGWVPAINPEEDLFKGV